MQVMKIASKLNAIAFQHPQKNSTCTQHHQANVSHASDLK